MRPVARYRLELGPVPLHHQVYLDLKAAIDVGEYKPGDRLPPERELAGSYGCSLITVRRALDELSREGRLQRHQGRGTFVLPPRLERDIAEAQSFTEEMQRRGLDPETRLIAARPEAASETVAAALHKGRLNTVMRLLGRADPPRWLFGPSSAADSSGAVGPSGAAGPFRVALTFDAEHPDRPTTWGVQERLLEQLERHGVRATFFVQGRWATAYPATARRIAEGGHLIGNHSHYHAQMPLLEERGLKSDIAAAQAAIIDATGVDPRPWFRCPFGSGAGDRRVRRVIAKAGYRHVGWHVVGVDWPIERTGADVEAAVVDGARIHGDGCVVLLHTWPDRTEAALDGIVARLRDSGAQLVRVDELPAALVPDRELLDVAQVPPSQG